jgi:hypothetical protein
MADVETVFAEQHLLLSGKGKSDRRPLVIRMFAPRRLDPASFSFQVAAGTAVCSVQFDGMSEEPVGDTYEADSLQALQLAADIEPISKGLSERWDSLRALLGFCRKANGPC